MHAQSTAGPLDRPTPAPALLSCGFGFCRKPATRSVETPSPIGGRIEWLCPEHALRRAELGQVLADAPINLGAAIVDPRMATLARRCTAFVDLRYWPTQAGRDLIARWRAERSLFHAEVTA